MNINTHNIAEIFKTQIVLKSQEGGVYAVICSFIVLAMFEMVTNFAKEIFVWLHAYVERYFREKFHNKMQTITATLDSKTSELYFERDYVKNINGSMWDKADAILSKILGIPDSQAVLVIGQLEIIKNSSEFHITSEIKFKLINLGFKEGGIIEHVSFKIFSDKLTVCDLREFVDRQTETYLIDKKNNLGDKLYFFDHIVEKKQKNTNYATGNQISDYVRFNKHLFVTNRTLHNVYHEDAENLRNRVQFFLEKKDWYDKRGIPHTFGLLLCGAPGTGKTSTIKAIANISKRHIININLSAIKTKTQLKKLFYDERIQVSNINGQYESLIIPINKRLYLIEDIDCLEGDLLLKRNAQVTTIKPISESLTFTNDAENEIECDLDLATILNIIDGTLETPGRILIISSNYPEKLDDALIRPGRIDMIIEYKKCNVDILIEMIQSFYNDNGNVSTDIDKVSLENINYKWTPAEVSQILFRNFHNQKQAISDLINLKPEQYFKYSSTFDKSSSSTLNYSQISPSTSPQVGSSSSSQFCPPTSSSSSKLFDTSNCPSINSLNNTKISSQFASQFCPPIIPNERYENFMAGQYDNSNFIDKYNNNPNYNNENHYDQYENATIEQDGTYNSLDNQPPLNDF